MTFTNVTKPTTSGWTSSNPVGKTTYDQSDITFDDANIYYDGGNPNSWTKLAKPNTHIKILAGMATGLLMPITYATEIIVDDGWTKITKP